MHFSGSIDEVRISNTARSADWIATEYNNQSNPTEFLSLGTEEVSSPIDLSSWQYRKAITIDHTKVSSSLTNFPVLINLSTDTDLASNAQSDGDDILFTLSSIDWKTGNQNEKLAHEVENFDSETGELQSWVNIPNLSNTSDTVLYMYYGNATASSQQNKTAVWDSDSKIVQHMNQDPSGIAPQMIDSTQYGNNGTSYGTMTIGQSVSGPVGSALNLDGVDDYVNISDNPSLDITGYGITMEAWVNPSAGSTQYSTILGRSLDNYTSWDFRVVSAIPNTITTTVAFRVNGNYYNGSTGANPMTLTLNNGTWYHLSCTYNGSQILVYSNGVLAGSYDFTSAISPLSTSESFTLGKFSASSYRSASILDEVRISNTARSAEWITTEYNNQSSPSTFLALSAEQSLMNHFTITGTSTQTAGNTQTITISAVDIYDTINTTYTGDKTIILSGANTIGSNTPTLTDKDGTEIDFNSPATITFTNGIATTDITLYQAEEAEIEATDGTYTTTGDEAYDIDITISPNTINSFTTNIPSSITSETPFSITLTAKDIYTNTTTDISNPTTLSIDDGTISLSSISNTEFQDDGIYTATITISDIYNDKNITLTIQNGSITQTETIAVTGLSYGSSFTPPAKPNISNIQIKTSDNGSPDIQNLPLNITHIAISTNPNFADSSWEPIANKDDLLKQYSNTTLYIKLRTNQGATSDTITYEPITLNEGDIVKTQNNFDVYIIKYKNNKRYKRLILSPGVFNSYQHLKWENIKTISEEQLDLYTTSSLVQVAGDDIIYELTPDGDTGKRKIMNPQEITDVDSIYEINITDRESYIPE